MPDVKTSSTPNRRERLFAATQADLSAAAREVMVEQGIEAVTLKEVAGRLGMTAPAIYRYFPSREALLERVIIDLYGELATHLAQARDSADPDSVSDRLATMARGFRQWALDHPPEFGLLFGAPIPGVAIDDDEKAQQGGAAFGQVWLAIFAEISASGRRPKWPRPIPKDIRAEIGTFLESMQSEIPIEVAMIYLYGWQSLYGAVCTEAFGHLKWALDDANELFETRLGEVLQMLELPPA